MRDIATTTLSGNLTRDVELRQLPSGADVARLRIATTTRRRNGEEWVDKTNYFTIEVFGAQARACAQYLRKGSRVFVDAEPDWREWTDQQDNKREAVTFKARQVLFEGGRPDHASNGTVADQTTPTPARHHPTGPSDTPGGANGGQRSRPGDRRRPAVLMIDTEHPRDADRSTRRPVQLGEENRRNDRRRVQVAAVQKQHPTVDSRSLCGLVTVDELDLYSDEVALRAWNTGPLAQCAQCRSTLLTRIRRPANADADAANRRTRHREHPRPAEPDQPIHEQRA